MTPTAEQILQAMQNHRSTPRTIGAKARDALAHVQHFHQRRDGAGNPSTGETHGQKKPGWRAGCE